MTKILIGALLILASANVVADNIFIYESEDEQEQISNIDSENYADKFTKKVKVIYYDKEGNLKQKVSRVSHDISNVVNSTRYANSDYDSLR